MNNHTPAFTAEQWKRTSIKKRIDRVKDLRNYIKWCKERYGFESNLIRFIRGQIENIRQSITPVNSAELNQEIAVSMKTALRITEHGVVRGFTNVRSWFSNVKAGLTLGKVKLPVTSEAVVFVVSCDCEQKAECFTLTELFGHEICDRAAVSDQLIDGLLDELLRRFEEWRCEKQILIVELGKFYKEVEQINCGV